MVIEYKITSRGFLSNFHQSRNSPIILFPSSSVSPSKQEKNLIPLFSSHFIFSSKYNQFIYGTPPQTLLLSCFQFPQIYLLSRRKMSEPPKYAYPYPAQGYYQGPPVMAPPQYAAAAPPPKRDRGFLEGCLAALCCCCVLDECCDLLWFF